MSKVTVRNAYSPRVGFGRLALELPADENADYEDRVVERRTLTAATLRVAAELESIAAAEYLECDISFANARNGIIDVDFRDDGLGEDAIVCFLMDACVNCGLAPSEGVRL